MRNRRKRIVRHVIVAALLCEVASVALPKAVWSAPPRSGEEQPDVADNLVRPVNGSRKDVTSPASLRFAARSGKDIPDFQRHVVPLLGRLGCNGRACHGSFQGRGGLRLSLFGFDFQQDLDALTANSTSTDGGRVDRTNAPQSLIVRKPTHQVDHEGGRRFDVGSWEHHVFLRWIAAGAKSRQNAEELKALRVEPPEVVLHGPDDAVQLRVIAEWGDGAREDVTCLCRFRSNGESVAKVTGDGHVRKTGHGDTHVVVLYDNGVTAIPILCPQGPSRPHRAEVRESIDGFVQAKLATLGIQPSELCTDTEFLRRVSIDVTGTLPTPDEVVAFLADSDPTKRSKKIDELLARPSYAAWWANKLCDFTGCSPSRQAEAGQELAVQWYEWIYARLRKNVSYDRIVEGIVVAVGREEDTSYDDYASATSAYFRETERADFSDRPTMPHYWSRSTLKTAQDRALAFAHSFLGLRLQCAQCHKHPWDQWTQGDFRQFSQFFADVKFGVRADGRKRYAELAKNVGLRVRGDDGSRVTPQVLAKARDGRVIPWREVYVAPRDASQELGLLRQRTVSLPTNADPRRVLMDWMREPSNPWFARALVNRVWASYFHVGLVDPPDDLNPANPPSHPRLLDWLSRRFVASGYDLHDLHRHIANSEAYQRSWRPNASNANDRRNFSRSIPRRIPAEVVYDALKQVTAASDRLDEVRTDLSRRASGHLSMRMAGTYAMNVFGKPDRTSNCDCERVNAPSLLQAVFLKNDPLVRSFLQSSGWIAEANDGTADGDDLVREAWLRCVGRHPNAQERDRALKYLRESSTIAEGLEDLLWALVNTKEFVLNH